MEKTTRRLPIVERDEWLQPVEAQMNLRHERYERKMADIGRSAGSLVDYANGYRYFGWQWDDVLDGWWLREWLPGAHDVYVFGDFNNWQRTEIRMHKDAAGVWSAFFPAAMYRDRLRTARSTRSTFTATTAGWTASRPTPGASCRTTRPKTTRRSSGTPQNRSTGGTTRSTPRRSAAC